MIKKVFLGLGLLVAVFGLLMLPQSSWAQSDAPVVLVLTVDGPVAPPMVEYIDRGLAAAQQRSAEIVLLELNTPGGSVTSMNRIVQSIRGSSIPVVVYVAPRGSMAASAGTLITLAGHAAAMAPETAIGAASPIGLQGEDLQTTEAQKEKEFLRATVRSLASNRPQQAIALAEDTIENARAVSSAEALQVGMIDFIASDTTDLLQQLDGFQVTMPTGPRILNTAGAVQVPLPSTMVEQVLALLTNPNIVFLLLTLGIQAILIEISSPGGWVAGFVGVVSVSLAVYGLGILPVNWFGMIFLVTAFALFVLDIKAPTHGALTAAGIGSFVAGSLILFNSPGVPSFQRVSVPLVIGTALFIAASFFTILTFVLRAFRRPVSTGQKAIIGQIGITREKISTRGLVQLGSELWTAELIDGEAPIAQGARVEVVKIEGVNLKIRRPPASPQDQEI